MSKSEQIQEEIHKLESEMSALDATLDRMYLEFIPFIVKETETWMRNHIEYQIKENAQVVNQGGADYVRNLKRDFQILNENIHEICVATIGDKDKWPHYRSGSTSSYPSLDLAFRKSISHLAPLLEKYNLIKRSHELNSEWRISTVNRSYEYGMNPGFEYKNINNAKKYDDLLLQKNRIINLISQKKEQREQALATELWENT